MRTCPGPGSPTGTSSSWSTSGPPCLWKRIALAMLSSPGDGGYCLVLLGWLGTRAHRLQRGALQLEPLDRKLHHVEVHVEPRLDRAQIGDALLDFLRVEGRHRHAGQRHAEVAPQAAEHLEGILRRRGLVSHGARRPRGG